MKLSGSKIVVADVPVTGLRVRERRQGVYAPACGGPLVESPLGACT